MNIQTAYWLPVMSGGWISSGVEQHTDWSIDYNRRLALTAEAAGFDYGLAAARFIGVSGKNQQLEAVTTSIYLSAITTKLQFVAAMHPGLWHPAIAAKVIATANYISGGRVSINVVSGWNKAEYTDFGEEWLEHDERYVRSEEFIRVLKGLWTEERFSFDGKYYHINEAPMDPKPASRPHPVIFQGGNSVAAREMAARVADVLFMNGNDLTSAAELIKDVKQRAQQYGRADKIRFALNGFIICRDTEQEAQAVYRAILSNARVEGLDRFRELSREAGRSSPEGKGMWANASDADLVQRNEGFKPGLIGTPEQVAQRIQQFEAVGVDILLTGFLHFIQEVEDFGWRIQPLLKELPSLRPQ
ncbi:MAG: dimethyl sulfone monooxygenase SfnG [Ktedonobacteraceae bacterium]